MAVWYSLWSSVTFFLIWCVWTKKNLATLLGSAAQPGSVHAPAPGSAAQNFRGPSPNNLGCCYVHYATSPEPVSKLVT
jgi:hypothetical protein